MRNLKQFNNCVRNGESKKSNVNLLEELSRLLTRMVSTENPNKMFLLRNQNHKMFVSFETIVSVMRKLPVAVATVARSKFLREAQLTPILKT